MLTIRDIKRAEEIGVSEVALRYRIIRGWDKEEAITTPPLKNKMDKYYEIAEKNGIGKATVKSRIYGYGWDIEKAITQPVDKRKSSRRKKNNA